jgi:Ca2+/H+ antiporter, TMEM165/GDT1 family
MQRTDLPGVPQVLVTPSFGRPAYRLGGRWTSRSLANPVFAFAFSKIALKPSQGRLYCASLPLGSGRLVMITWTVAAPAISAAFLSSLVEAVEALTIVLAVGTVRGWRPAGLGALAGLLLLALIVLALGPLLDRVPLYLLQLAIGVLLLLFGMRWLRKAILRAAGVIPLHDEAIAFATETAQLREQERRYKARLDWLAALASFKAVFLEGLEVVFIVIAVGAGRGLMIPASIGAIAACVLVAGFGLAVHHPLARVPENTLKFAVGVMLSAFGVFWIGEGLGVPWPGEDIAIIVIAALFLLVALLAVAVTRRRAREALQ